MGCEKVTDEMSSPAGLLDAALLIHAAGLSLLLHDVHGGAGWNSKYSLNSSGGVTVNGCSTGGARGVNKMPEQM